MPSLRLAGLVVSLCAVIVLASSSEGGTYVGAIPPGKHLYVTPDKAFVWPKNAALPAQFNVFMLRWEVRIPYRIARTPAAGGNDAAGFDAAETAEIRLAFETWNRRIPAIRNLMRGAGGAANDIQSVALHEAGHTLGMGHPNHEKSVVAPPPIFLAKGGFNRRVAQREPRYFAIIDGIINAIFGPIGDAGQGPDTFFATIDDTPVLGWPLFEKDRIFYYDDPLNDPWDASCGLPFDFFPCFVFPDDAIPVRERGFIAAGPRYTQEAVMVQGATVRDLKRWLQFDDLCTLLSLETRLAKQRLRAPIVYQFVFNPGVPVLDLPGPDATPSTADDIDDLIIGGVVQANGGNVPRHTVDVFRTGLQADTLGLTDNIYDVPNRVYDASDIHLASLTVGGVKHVGVVPGIGDSQGIPIEDGDYPYSRDQYAWATADCDDDGTPDLEEIYAGAPDCDGNEIPDTCQGDADCDGNTVPDLCDLADGTLQDCNGNYVPDACDIASGHSLDTNFNGVPDECELAVTGACCLSDETCVDDVLAADCADAGETFLQGQECANVDCPELPRGACCNETTGACTDDVSVMDCAPPLAFLGDGSSCATESCGPAVGACCSPDGSCAEGVAETDCAADPFAAFYADSSCASVGCDELESGACCNRVTGTCMDGVRFDDCVLAAGEFHGDGATCATIPTCSPAVGACCLEDQTCLDGVLPGDCAGVHNLGQTCAGLGTCDPIPTGACCDTSIGHCADGVLETHCQSEYKVFTAGAMCNEIDCPLISEIGGCCMGADCLLMTPDDCTLNSGAYEGDGSSCDDCCLGDLNGDDTVGFADLTQVLIHWGPCPGGGNPCPWDIFPVGAPDGTVGFGDLTTILLNWGPC